MTIPFTSLVTGLPADTPFVGPEALERQRGKTFVARIGANESAFGLSPKTIDAMTAAVQKTNWYGDPDNYELRQSLAKRHDVTVDEICVDAGIDSLLGLTARAFVTTGTPVVSSAGAYPTFFYHVAGFGGRASAVPYRDDHEDIEALLATAIKLSAPLMYLSNPDNPMGTWHDADTINQLIDQVPPSTVLALDEAYAEFAPPGVIPPIDTSNPRVMRFRTFSKAFGMAGSRIGYVVAHRDLITGLNKIRTHFAVNRIAQAGALASLADTEFLAGVVKKVAEGRRRIYQLAQAHGISAIRSATNFVAIDLHNEARARKLLSLLADRDIFVRMPGVAPLNRCVRIGIGTDTEHQALETAFAQALELLD